jgi:hypothetical protein
MIDTPSARDSLYRGFPLSRNADKQNPAASAIFPDTSGTHPHRETSQETASRFEGNRAQLPRIPMNESLLHIDIGGAKWIPRLNIQQNNGSPPIKDRDGHAKSYPGPIDVDQQRRTDIAFDPMVFRFVLHWLIYQVTA